MLCKNCVHFTVCANVYCEVTEETEIRNIHGKPCYYFEDKSKYIEHLAYSNLGEAIQDVQDMIDVLDVTGSAYIYKHNGGRTRLENILCCLINKVVNCKDIEFGSYQCYAKVPGYNISCDRCLVTEIKILNDMGIKTIGCCCGHQKHPGYIQVDPEYIEKMRALGYKHMSLDKNGNGQWCFEPKSILLNNGCLEDEV